MRPRPEGDLGKFLAADEPAALLGAANPLAVPVLEFYEREARARGACAQHLKDLAALRTRVTAWQAAHPDLVRLPTGE